MEATAVDARPHEPCHSRRRAWARGEQLPTDAERLAALESDRKYWEAWRDEQRAKAMDYLATLPIIAFQTGTIRLLKNVQCDWTFTPYIPRMPAPDSRPPSPSEGAL